MQPSVLLLIAAIWLGLVHTSSSFCKILRPKVFKIGVLVLTASSFKDNDKGPSQSLPSIGTPSIGFPPIQIFPDYPSKAERVAKKDSAAGSMIMDIQRALLADDMPKAIHSFDHLKREIGLQNLTNENLEMLLYVFSKSSSSASLVDEVLKEINDRGIMGELQLKEKIFLSACKYEHIQIIRALLPHLGIKQCRAVLKLQLSPDVRKSVLESLDASVDSLHSSNITKEKRNTRAEAFYLAIS